MLNEELLIAEILIIYQGFTMIKKLFSIFLLFTNLFVVFANNAPIISNFRIEDSDKTKVYFDSSEPITGSDITGFYLSGVYYD